MKETKRFTFDFYFSIYLGLFSFVTLVLPRLTTLMVLGLAVFVIIAYVKKKVSWKLNLPGVLLMLLYLAYIIGIFFSHELANGLKYAEYKLAFLILPALLSIRPKFSFSIREPVIGLILATIVLAVIGVMNSCACYNEHNSNWLLYCFSSSFLSPVHHPSYYAIFLLFALIGVWHGYKMNWYGFRLFPVIIYSLFALMMYFLCLSLAGILFLGLALIAWTIYYLYKRFGKLPAIGSVIVLPILIFLILSRVPGFADDIRETKAGLTEYLDSPDKFLKRRVTNEEIPGNQKRLVMWTVTTELIKEHPMGVGTGNVDEYLFARLNHYGFHQLVEEELNPHNQYLQTTLEIGVIGGLLFVAFLISICWMAIMKKSILLLLLGSGLAFNSLFESIFQQQSGIIFYAFWVSIMVLYTLDHTTLTNKASSNYIK